VTSDHTQVSQTRGPMLLTVTSAQVAVIINHHHLHHHSLSSSGPAVAPCCPGRLLGVCPGAGENPHPGLSGVDVMDDIRTVYDAPAPLPDASVSVRTGCEPCWPFYTGGLATIPLSVDLCVGHLPQDDCFGRQVLRTAGLEYRSDSEVYSTEYSTVQYSTVHYMSHLVPVQV
jgi:hypothetical protein